MLDLPPCPSCGAVLRPEAYDADAGVVTCPSCGGSFDVEVEAPPEVALPAPTTAPTSAPPIEEELDAVAVEPVPEGMVVSRQGDRLVVVHRWYGTHYVALLVFAVMWNGFMAVWHAIALASGQIEMVLFGGLHTFIGLAVAYTAVAGLLNHTTVVVRPTRLEVRHGPLPWPGRRDIPVAQLEQLFVVRHQGQSSKGGVHTTYEVHASLRGSAPLTLVRGLKSYEQASQTERRIERVLHIVDVPVPGEFGRNG